MSNLDDKLREIIYQCLRVENVGVQAIGGIRPIIVGDDETIAQIKQAFADEQNLVMRGVVDPKEGGLLTGQEWYEKFEKEWQRSIEGRYFDGDSLAKATQEAAKRAAGLE